jgi:hypothetical protein
MMEAKSVKGPYLRDGRTVYALVPMLPQDQSGNGPKECNSFFCTVQGCNGKYSATEEQLEATAALFESAPELLKELQVQMTAMNWLLKAIDIDPTSAKVTLAELAARTQAACAKALGGAE